MKKSLILFVLAVLTVSWSASVLLAQERRDREGREGRDGRRSRSDEGGGRFGGGPPGGFGGPGFGGGPPGGFGGPGFGGGPPGGFGGRFGGGPGGPGGGGDDASRNERRIAMLKAMDTNGDGKLDPNEIPEYRRNFVSMLVRQMGGDPSKTIVLADLERKAAANAGSSQARRSSTSSSSSSTGLSLLKDPLVPYFGEKEPELPAVIAFGQREPVPKSTGSSGSASGVVLSQSDQLMRTAREIMNRYDKNKNGTLDKDKGEWSSSLPFNPEAADKNHDGRISMTELVAALGGKSSGTLGSGVVSTKQSNAYDRLPAGVPDWFFERDKDQDGQLTMQEYANGQPWTDAIAEEFTFLDTNNDGYATVAEVFAALKKVDDEKRLKEEQAKRELQRRQGAGTPVAAATTTPTTETPPNPESPGVPGPPPGSPPPPGAPGAPPGPPGSETSVASPAPGTPSSPPPVPAESGPNWKPQPGAAPSETKAIPQSAPYSSGSESGSKNYSRDKDRERKDYRRPSQYRGTGR